MAATDPLLIATSLLSSQPERRGGGQKGGRRELEGRRGGEVEEKSR